MRCFKCQRYGHGKDRCKKSAAVCVRCGKGGQNSDGHLILTFDSPKLQSRMRAGYLTLDVRPYSPLPIVPTLCPRQGQV
ncbi:hypothetical protein PoB_004020300 [Plakobranchus ocellatus]|uniref:CCHC-type domain-containing protein n=1 Tax=Plakobranchus ocellatus TaxID=259542 RepID=A0AAV4B3L1_9GAST|nr:hypothetical protein PoB_004020300 [Plakobranchus ocellatus]